MAIKANRELILKNVRFSYLYAFEGFKNDDGKISYCSHFILPPDHPQLKEVTQAIKDVAADFWKDDAPAALAEMKAKNKLCLKKGELKGNADGYAGNYFISGNSKNRFRVVETRNGVNVELTAGDGRPRSGDYGNAIIAIYAMNHPKGGKLVACQIQGIQYTRKGAPLGGGGRVAAVDEFGIDPSDADGAAPAAASSGGSGNADDLLG